MYKKYKTRIKYIMSNKNIKPIHLIILSCAFIFFMCGFSLLTSALNINGTANYSIYPRTLDTSSNLEFRNSTYLSKIKTITFNNTINTPGTVVASWDVSDLNDGTVIAYIVKNSSDNTKYDLYIEANGEINANINSSSLFSGMTSLTTINNLNILNTSKVTNMSNMFYNCTSLSSLDISNFDASNVTNMSNMFTNVTGTITIPNQTGDIENTTTKYYGKTTSTYASGTFTLPVSLSFSSDSWETIESAIISGKAQTAYHVGDTKCVHLNGFTTNNNNGCNGDFKLRISNMSTPSECSRNDFSETACGFVLEFEDVILERGMNSTDKNIGGWPASEMRTYVNSSIYNALPSDLKNIILSTKVISGHGPTAGETNFTTNDKLYLLSSREVMIDDDESGQDEVDTAYYNTRQLDFYEEQGVTISSYSDIVGKKYEGYVDFWWLRTADNYHNSSFLEVGGYFGTLSNLVASDDSGISPAFRIGYNPNKSTFSTDTWSTIKQNVSSGKASEKYNIGDEKTVNLGSLGTHKVRIANMSKPSQCSGTNFSQTACGFVLEFVDIVTEHKMNSTDTASGGWPASGMRSYLNNEIYNNLPSDLKSVISTTKVISGTADDAGTGTGPNGNFVSNDYLYLLSAREIMIDGDLDKVSHVDRAYNNTRQLDFYEGLNVTTDSSLAAVKKYNGNESSWWLRTPNGLNNAAYPNYYLIMGDSSNYKEYGTLDTWDIESPDELIGVSFAFRIT